MHRANADCQRQHQSHCARCNLPTLRQADSQHGTMQLSSENWGPYHFSEAYHSVEGDTMQLSSENWGPCHYSEVYHAVEGDGPMFIDQNSLMQVETGGRVKHRFNQKGSVMPYSSVPVNPHALKDGPQPGMDEKPMENDAKTVEHQEPVNEQTNSGNLLSTVYHTRRSPVYGSECLVSSIGNLPREKTSVSWVVPSKTMVISSYDGCIYWSVIHGAGNKRVDLCASLTHILPFEIDMHRGRLANPKPQVMNTVTPQALPDLGRHMNPQEVRFPFKTETVVDSGNLKYVADRVAHEYELTITCEGKLHTEWLYDHYVEIMDQGKETHSHMDLPSEALNNASFSQLFEGVNGSTHFCNTCTRLIRPSTTFTGPRMKEQATKEKNARIQASMETVTTKKVAAELMKVIRKYYGNHPDFDIGPLQKAYDKVCAKGTNVAQLNKNFNRLKNQTDKIMNGHQDQIDRSLKILDDARAYQSEYGEFLDSIKIVERAIKQMKNPTDENPFLTAVEAVGTVQERLAQAMKINPRRGVNGLHKEISNMVEHMDKIIRDNTEKMPKGIQEYAELKAIQGSVLGTLHLLEGVNDVQELEEALHVLKVENGEMSKIIQNYMNNKASIEAKGIRMSVMRKYIDDSENYLQTLIDKFDAVPEYARDNYFKSAFIEVKEAKRTVMELSEDAKKQIDENTLTSYKQETERIRGGAVECAKQAKVIDAQIHDGEVDDNEWHEVKARKSNKNKKQKQKEKNVIQPSFQSKITPLANSHATRHAASTGDDKKLPDTRKMTRIREYELTFLCCGATVQRTRIERINNLPLDIHGNPLSTSVLAKHTFQDARISGLAEFETGPTSVETGGNWADEMDDDEPHEDAPENTHKKDSETQGSWEDSSIQETAESIASKRSDSLTTYVVRFKSSTIGGLNMCYTTTRGKSLQFRHIRIHSVDDVEIVSARQAELKKSYKDHLLGEPSLMHDSKMVEGPAAYEVPKIGIGNIMKKEGGDRYELSPKFRHMKEDEVQEILRTPEERRESVRRDSDEERRLPLEHVSVSRDGARFAACAWNGRCIIYSPSSKVLSDLSIELPKHGTIGGEQDDILVLRGHVGEVAHATWAPDDKFLATASTDHTVRIWNPVNGRQLLIIEGSKHELRTVAWSVVDGYYLASAGDEGLINIWKMRAWMNFASGLGEMPKKLLPEHNPSKGSLYIGDYSRGAVLCLSWSPMRNILAAGYHDGGALVWDAHSGEKLFALKEKVFEQKINGHTIKWRDPSATHIHAISWHPEEKFIVTGGGDDRAINLWHVHKTAQLVYASEPGDHIASVKDSHTEQIWGIDMSMDGKLLVSCGEDYDINIFRSDDLASNFGRNYDVGRKIEHITTIEERKDNYKQYHAHGGGRNSSTSLSKRRERILEFERQKNQEKGQR